MQPEQTSGFDQENHVLPIEITNVFSTTVRVVFYKPEFSTRYKPSDVIDVTGTDSLATQSENFVMSNRSAEFDMSIA